MNIYSTYYDIMLLVLYNAEVREAIQKNNGLVMEIFRKGSDPPPLIFGSYGTREAQFNFGHQKGKN